MIERYTRKRMGKVWSEKNRFLNWVKVEVAVLMAKVVIGELKVKIPKNFENSIKISVKEINWIEQEETKHDVIAFLIHTSNQLPEELRPYWHDRMTFYDTQDPGLILQLLASVCLFIKETKNLMQAVKEKAFEYKYTAKVGRTHGIHAEPITFGVEWALWYDELGRHLSRLKRLEKQVAVAKFSGAVGIYTMSPAVEKKACQILGLRSIIANQIIPRDIHAEFLSKIAMIGGFLEKVAINIRTWQRTEIFEAQEYFSPDQKGSSAMPHKKNPIGSENISGLVRILRANAQVGFEDQRTWDERDITNSGPERIVLPDSSILLDFLLARLTKIVKKLIVYPERMRENLYLTKGLIYSQDVLSLMVEKSGLSRDRAYKPIQEVAFKCWSGRLDFYQELLTTPEVMKHIISDELKKCFDFGEKVKYVDYIFNRVFGKED